MQVRLKEDLILDILDNKLVILNTDDNKLIDVNEIGRIIIEYIKENNNLNIEMILSNIKREYEIEGKDKEIETDIIDFVNQLLEIGILVK